MENAIGMIVFIMIIIFTGINLSILHSRYFIVYFSGEARFRHIFYAFFLAWIEVGLIVKIFTGVFGVVFNIIKFILKIILVLAIIAAVGFLLAKLLPKILPKTKPVINKILLFINDKLHIFVIKPNKAEDENTETDKGDPIPEENRNDEGIVMDQIMRCRKCGKPLLKGALFCQECGESVPNAESLK